MDSRQAGHSADVRGLNRQLNETQVQQCPVENFAVPHRVRPTQRSLDRHLPQRCQAEGQRRFARSQLFGCLGREPLRRESSPACCATACFNGPS